MPVLGNLNTMISAIPKMTLQVTFRTRLLAWFRVDEYSGLTGRKGTTVVSVTRVLWFCVASQTSQRKEPEIESHHHGEPLLLWGPRLPRHWGDSGKYTPKPTHTKGNVDIRIIRTVETRQVKHWGGQLVTTHWYKKLIRKSHMVSHLHQSLACQLHRTHPWQVLQTNDYLAESKKIPGTQGTKINTSRRRCGDCDLVTILSPMSYPKQVFSKYPLLNRHFQNSTDLLETPASHSSLPPWW